MFSAPWIARASRPRPAPSRATSGCGMALVCAVSLSACGEERPTPPPQPIAPPFGGTIFIDPDIVTPSDPSTFVGLTDTGQASRTMFDRRVDGWVTLEPYLFDATFSDGLTVEMQVNPEFGSVDAARAEAETYARAIGQLPTSLRSDVETSWIHQGVEPFGGGNRNLLIHVGQAALYVRDGILEETLIHEATHSSIDAAHQSAPGWIAAQASDPTYISDYARDFPVREDLAETMVPYIAVRFRPDRISADLLATIMEAIPARIEYLDGLGLDMHPIN